MVAGRTKRLHNRFIVRASPRFAHDSVMEPPPQQLGPSMYDCFIWRSGAGSSLFIRAFQQMASYGDPYQRSMRPPDQVWSLWFHPIDLLKKSNILSGCTRFSLHRTPVPFYPNLRSILQTPDLNQNSSSGVMLESIRSKAKKLLWRKVSLFSLLQPLTNPRMVVSCSFTVANMARQPSLQFTKPTRNNGSGIFRVWFVWNYGHLCDGADFQIYGILNHQRTLSNLLLFRMTKHFIKISAFFFVAILPALLNLRA